MSNTTNSNHDSSRRDFVKSSLGLALLSSAALAAPAAACAPAAAGGTAQAQGALRGEERGAVIARAIPRTKEVVRAMGFGTFMPLDVEPGGKRDTLFEAPRRFWQAGGRVIDTSPLYGMAEVNV